mmetsp:Transcript_26502/g.47574  ORF Transcript_26502/g.47574 Transcript_26502/m.47574 type:complete len:727 (-) Transcript_26502:33-2213(-)
MRPNRVSNSIDVIAQASHAAYEVMEHTPFEARIPINPNTLMFTDTKVQNNYLSDIYLGRSEGQVAGELKNALTIYYVFLVPYLTLIFAVSLGAYFYDVMTASEVGFHCSVSAAILAFSIALVKGTLTHKEIRLKTHFWYCAISVIAITYFLLGDSRVYTSFIDGNESEHRIKILGVVGVLAFFQLVSFYNFFMCFLLVSYTIVLHGALIFGTTSQSMSEKVWEFLNLLILLIGGLFWCHQYDFRCKQIFWRLKVEENAFSSLKEDASRTVRDYEPDTNIGSEFEKLIRDCDELRNRIKNSASVIIFKDVRNSLKHSATLAEHIKRQIVHGINHHVFLMQPDLNGLDEEDKEFIHDHYADVSRASGTSTSRKNSLVLIDVPFHGRNIAIGFSELEQMLDGIGKNWAFDIWLVHQSTGRSVSVVGKYLLHKWGYLEKASVKESVVDKFLLSLEANYRSNPYHNACHAADVMHSCLFFILNSDLKNHLDQFELLATTVAALGHDVGHPGLTNRFLVNARDKLAIRYNDMSVLENMHCSIIFELLQEDSSNILSTLAVEEWVRVRKMVVDMVLATDLAKHFEIVSVFKTRAFNVNDIQLEVAEDKLLVMKMSLKCADVSHSSKPLAQHQYWTNLVSEEFFLQGDKEKELGLAVSMYCDRDTTDLPKSQAGFLKNICVPLFESFAAFLRSDALHNQVMLSLKFNLHYWENVTLKSQEKDFLDGNTLPIGNS